MVLFYFLVLYFVLTLLSSVFIWAALVLAKKDDINAGRDLIAKSDDINTGRDLIAKIRISGD